MNIRLWPDGSRNTAANFGLLKTGAAEYPNTLNIGLLNDKANLTIAGGFMAIIGAIFHACAVVSQGIRQIVFTLNDGAEA